MLSGFVITHAYGGRLNDGAARLQFLVRRFGRLYPLHLATLGLVLAMELGRWGAAQYLGRPVGPPAFAGDTELMALPANLLLFHAWGLFRDFSWNVPSWSISVEWALCGLFVLASLWRRPILVAIVLAGAGLGLPIWFTTLDVYPPEGRSAMVRGLYGFFLGVLAYRLFMIARARGFTLPGWAEWAGPLLLAAAIWTDGHQVPYLRPPLFAALVLLFAAEAGPLSRLMRQGPLIWAGKVSYSIYLVHYPIILALLGGLAVLGGLIGAPLLVEERGVLLIAMPNLWAGDLAAIAFLALTLAVAGVTFHWIEEPGRLWFNRLARRSPPAETAPT